MAYDSKIYYFNSNNIYAIQTYKCLQLATIINVLKEINKNPHVTQLIHTMHPCPIWVIVTKMFPWPCKNQKQSLFYFQSDKRKIYEYNTCNWTPGWWLLLDKHVVPCYTLVFYGFTLCHFWVFRRMFEIFIAKKCEREEN